MQPIKIQGYLSVTQEIFEGELLWDHFLKKACHG